MTDTNLSSEARLREQKFKHGQRVLVRAVIGPSGMIGDNGVFVNVNTEDPEIWVHVKDVGPIKAKPKGKP